MPATGGIPTLSQVRSWNTDYLTEAADHWTRTAVVWEDSFTALANQISMPGGTPWEGEAADAAFASAHTDRMTVIGLADELHAAARIARTGAGQIDFARSAVLRVVEAAEAADFVVGEDFSVTCPGLFDPVTAAARHAQAEAIATDLRAVVGTLAATDAEVASSLTAATGGLGTTLFPEPDDAPGTVQLVDYKTAPPTEPGTPDDPVSDTAPSPSPVVTPAPSRSWPPAPIDPEQLAPFGPEGTVFQKTAEEATKHGVNPKIPLSEGKQLGDFMGKLGNFGDLYKAFDEGRKELPREGWKNTLIDIVPKTAGSLAGQTLGGTFGAVSGARVGAATGSAWGHIPGMPGARPSTKRWARSSEPLPVPMKAPRKAVNWVRRSARGCLAIYVRFSTEIQSAGLRGRRPFAHLVRARLLKGCNAIAIVVLALAGVGCGFEREAAAPAPPGDPASYGCAVNMAIPMTVVPSRGPDEPFLSVPTPSGWEFIARDKEQVRGALASVALRSQDFTPNAVITLADVSADYATPQQAIDGEQLGLAGEVHIDATQDGTLCGYPARTVNYLYEGRHATTLIVAGTDARKRTWISTVGIQSADPSVAGFAEDKALILNNFQFLIRHLGDIAT